MALLIDNLVDALVLAPEKGGLEGEIFHVTDGVDDTSFLLLEHLARAGRTRLSLSRFLGRQAPGAGFDVLSRRLPCQRPSESAVHLQRRSLQHRDDAERLGYQARVSLEEGMARLARCV